VNQDATNNGGPDPSDEALASTVRLRDQSPDSYRRALDAFEILYRRYGHRLLGFLAARVRRSDLEDVQQTVWQRVWQHLPGKFRGGNFRAWLHRIARNHLVDESRRNRPDLLPDEQPLDDPRGLPPESQLLESERYEVLERCLGHLPDEQAAIVRARLAGETYESICERTETPPARAHKLFHQAKEQLVQCFERSFR
jgi:RNA polymerase sigma factor (sigma-70 family)